MALFQKICMNAALAGGNAISDYKPTDIKIKKKSCVGHHAIVTSADYKSQIAILRKISKDDVDALFICEENIKEKMYLNRIIRSSKLEKLLTSSAYIIDELDGSSSFDTGLFDWCVSVGYVNKMEHKAGAVFAPKIYGGALFSGSKGNGASAEINGKARKCAVKENEDLTQAYVLFGYDCFLKKYGVHNELLSKLGDTVRTVNSGPCALGLSLVAAGIVDAVVQPVQSPWDWAAGKVLVEEAGGQLLFYEMEKGLVFPISELKPKHYNPDKRMVGFVAGNKEITEQIMEMIMDINSSYKINTVYKINTDRKKC